VTGDPDLDLAPSFQALCQLRLAYRSHPHDATKCDQALRKVRGLLTSARVRDLVDPLLADVYELPPLSVEKRKRLLEKEQALLGRIGGLEDKALLREALRSADQNAPVIEWCRSVGALATYLESFFAGVRGSLREAPWWDLRQRKRNAELLRDADRAVVAVGIVLVDVLKKYYLPASYHIGRYLATGVKG